MRYTVDRMEEQIVICELEDRTTKEFPRSLFPINIKAGDIVEENANGFTILEEETKERKERIARLMESLWD